MTTYKPFHNEIKDCIAYDPADIPELAQYRLYSGLYCIQFNHIKTVPVQYHLVQSVLAIFAGTSRYKNNTTLQYEAATSIPHNPTMHFTQQEQPYWMFWNMLSVEIHFSLSSSRTGQHFFVCMFIYHLPHYHYNPS